MSVQAGIWNLNGKPADQELLAKIGESEADYAPDGETIHIHGAAGMLYRPFHTTAESRLERQPFVSSSGKVFTWDGRLDNRDAMMDQIRNVLTDDLTDVAIVAAAFERWGTDCFAKLIGDWAISISDMRNRELILARDYIGVRHLFYFATSDKILWCTHLSPLVKFVPQLSLCDDFFAGYLTLWPDAHLTPYKEIQSVPPGKFVRFAGNKIETCSHWRFDPKAEILYKTDAEYEEHFRHLFRQAIRRRLRTDSPILADLSGGLDSSSIVCVADDILAKKASGTPALDTFSFCDYDEPDEEDFLYFTKVEEKRGRTGFHAELRTSGDSLSFDYPKFVPAPGFGEREEVKAMRVELMRKYKHRVLFSGSGGDEMLGQALDPTVQLADSIFRFRFIKCAQLLGAWSLLLRRPLIDLAFDAVLLLLPVSIRSRLKRSGRIQLWIDATFANRSKLARRTLLAAEGSWLWSPIARDAFQTVSTLSRQMTNAVPSLQEKRYPYLDQTLVEFLISIPTDQVVRPGQRRSLMRRSLADHLPPEISARRTKSGSGRCYVATLQKHWDEVDNTLTAPSMSRLGYVNGDRLRAAMKAATNGHIPQHFFQLLRCFSAELWIKDMISRGMISIERERSRLSRSTLTPQCCTDDRGTAIT